jgi:hypothetical protein
MARFALVVLALLAVCVTAYGRKLEAAPIPCLTDAKPAVPGTPRVGLITSVRHRKQVAVLVGITAEPVCADHQEPVRPQQEEDR